MRGEAALELEQHADAVAFLEHAVAVNAARRGAGTPPDAAVPDTLDGAAAAGLLNSLGAALKGAGRPADAARVWASAGGDSFEAHANAAGLLAEQGPRLQPPA